MISSFSAMAKATLLDNKIINKNFTIANNYLATAAFFQQAKERSTLQRLGNTAKI